MIALEHAAHERPVDRPAVYFLILGQTLLALLERRAAFAGPDEGVQREPGHALGMALREDRGAQRSRGNSVEKQLLRPGGLHDVMGHLVQVVGAVRDVAIDRALLVRAAVALVV